MKIALPSRINNITSGRKMFKKERSSEISRGSDVKSFNAIIDPILSENQPVQQKRVREETKVRT